jgi:hypothetical protein
MCSQHQTVPTIYENEADAKKAARDASPKPNKQRRKMMWGGVARSAETHESSSGSGGSKSRGSKGSKEEESKGSGILYGTPSMSNHLNSDAKSLFSVYVGNDDNVSILTDDFHDLDMNQRQQQQQQQQQQRKQQMVPSGSTNALFTFRRTIQNNEDETSTRETTLQAKLAQPICNEDDSSSSSEGQQPKKRRNQKYTKEEIMSDLVKRLQEMAKTKASGVLRFPKEERIAIKDGEKRIVFVLPQLNHAKFSKEDFGHMKAGEVLGLVPDRPVIVDIETEDTGDGETLELF